MREAGLQPGLHTSIKLRTSREKDWKRTVQNAWACVVRDLHSDRCFYPVNPIVIITVPPLSQESLAHSDVTVITIMHDRTDE